MAYLTCALFALHFLPPTVILALHCVSDGCSRITAAIRDLDISDEDALVVIACMKRARRAERKTYIYAAFAPVVTFYALLFTPRDADRLPRWARKWDNNVSLNGDAYAVLRAGKWVTLRGKETIQPGEVAVSYDDPAYTGKAYYCKGFHPRSFLARWVWVGWRNRASGLSLAKGPTLTEPATLVAGAPDAGRGKPGFFLLRSGGEYQYRSFTKVGPLMRITNYGAKLDYAQWLPGGVGQVPYVAIGLSFKGAR